MRTSDKRILTTHVGSLPRSEAVVALLERHENGEALDAAVFKTTIGAAVTGIVRRQVDLGIDVVSDGETSKISYATYVKDRLTGFSDEGSIEPARPHRDLQPFPDLQRKMALLTGKRRFKRVACIGKIAYRGQAALAEDLANMRRAVDAAKPTDAFLNAASPGVVASFLANQHYPSHEAYIDAVAEAMREEYEAIVDAGFVLQIDCPDLAMSRQPTFQDLSEADFLKRAQFHVEALNHACANIPADMLRIHVCWGNYEGPHDYDIDLAKIAADRPWREGHGACRLKRPIRAMNTNGRCGARSSCRTTRCCCPACIDTSTNYVEHPDLVAQRIVRLAEIVGRDRVIASTDCGFGTSAGYGKIDPEIAYLKLGALVAGAEKASRALWR